MFTGLVLGIGEILQIHKLKSESRLTVKTLFAVTDWIKGESIAVNGVCLSVESFAGNTFTAYASMETLSISNLQELQVGEYVNLERALRPSDRMGGHFVSGHVDALAELESVRSISSSIILRLKFPEQFSRQIIAKGSVTLDGISLTINSCGNNFLEVNIIPETLTQTTVKRWKPGRKVNLETDLIGKYIDKILQSYLSGAQNINHESSPITFEFLQKHGF